VFTFDVVTGTVALRILRTDRNEVIDIVRNTYLTHDLGDTVNPDSYFLRFPERPEARIIALPAFVGDGVRRAGIKWIASYPANLDANAPRASAVIILNDYETGYPIACVEAAAISAARTAASAAIAATVLRPAGFDGTRISVIGAGVIARNICDYLLAAGCLPDSYVVHDIAAASGEALVEHIHGLGQSASFTPSLAEALDADTVVLATTAPKPYITAPFRQGQVVLNISLRDIAPDVVLAANNVLDDVEHCLKANTSPHLAEQASGARDFVTGTIAGLIKDDVRLARDRPTIFSPFGLGVLDLAVASHVHDTARAEGTAIEIPDFYGETRRW
jgi:N-[(2S)-2-amino-2-carboxyethyl]-L-glutamate dehydrogenase